MAVISRVRRASSDRSKLVDVTDIRSVNNVDDGADYDDNKPLKESRFSWFQRRQSQQSLLRRWHRMTRIPTPTTRAWAICLALANLVILWHTTTIPPTSLSSHAECQQQTAILFSLEAWQTQHYQARLGLLPSTYQPPSSISTIPRSQRFPSVSSRVRYYMGQWYQPDLQGIPPSSPFGPYWMDRVMASQQQQQQQQSTSPWDPARLAHDPILNPLNLNATSLYQCSMGTLVTQDLDDPAVLRACSNNMNENPDGSVVQRHVWDTIPAALLIQEYSSRRFLWNWDEGVLGWIQELWIVIMQTWLHTPLSTQPFASLWHYGRGVPRATTLWNTETPIFARVRDLIAEKDIEYHRRQRYAGSRETKDCAKCGPLYATITWPLDRDRIETPVALVPLHDIPWENKRNQLIWRGGDCLGWDLPSNPSILSQTKTDEEIISSFQQRLAVVTKHQNSLLVNAKFTQSLLTRPEQIPRNASDAFLPLSEMLQYKYLLAIEGYDVSSGLLWMLFSNSVVFMSDPTYTSWAMEGTYLKPWVHYIPVHRNMSNVEEQVKWASDHSQKAREIAERSTMFVYDLLFHPDVAREEAAIMRTMVYRYQQFVLKGKQLWKWGHIGERIRESIQGKCTSWYEWLTDDWLRIAFVVVLFTYLWTLWKG